MGEQPLFANQEEKDQAVSNQQTVVENAEAELTRLQNIGVEGAGVGSSSATGNSPGASTSVKFKLLKDYGSYKAGDEISVGADGLNLSPSEVDELVSDGTFEEVEA